MSRYVCVHGHFYQPPRENPWLETVERQPSAAPYHDWNERIVTECYRPNATARILDREGRIRRIVSNYELISFNVGPTLLAWLEEEAPDVYEAILAADGVSRRRFSGHGSALAQAYNHAILPLSGERQRRIQVRWGIRDFERRFGRPPEGMWLPETAVDIPTLETLCAEGIRFTILAPHQARRVRSLDGGSWQSVDPKSLDTGRAYEQRLPSGRSIALFFYHGGLARGVAFEGLLESGEAFADRLLAVAREGPDDGPRLAHLAADGESYGHHHRFGEMALASALERVEASGDVRLTNYGGFLEQHPPTREVDIADETSWSCVHGVERWRSDCGCRSGGEPGWSQAWRAPLREALDLLHEGLAPRREAAASGLLTEPERAVTEYVDLVPERSRPAVVAFLDRHVREGASQEERVRALQLLELERQLQLMYTSCGWFFNDLAGIETLQVLAYAARALDLARRALGDVDAVEAAFLGRLEDAESNRPDRGDGRDLWEREVLPRVAGARDAALHWAVGRAVAGTVRAAGDDGAEDRFYAWSVQAAAERRSAAGGAALYLGRGVVRSVRTLEETSLRWGVLRLGQLSLACGVEPVPGGEEAGRTIEERLVAALEAGDPGRVLALLEDGFPDGLSSLPDLWPDERRGLVREVAGEALDATAVAARASFERHAPLLRAMTETGLELPAAWEAAAAMVFHGLLADALAEARPDRARIADLLARAERLGVRLDPGEVRRIGRSALERAADRFAGGEIDPERLEALERTLAAVRALPFEVGRRRAQDRWWEVRRRLADAADGGEGAAVPDGWEERFLALGEALGFAPDGRA